MILLHILAGAIALIAGTIALLALKGARLHRKSGMVFVCAMLAMSATGAGIGAIRGKGLSVLAGALTFYLVLSAWVTVQHHLSHPRYWHWALMLTGLTIGLGGVLLGINGLNHPTGEIDGEPAMVAVVFGSVALLAALLDIRLLFARSIASAHRLARHLWRMCFALLLAAASFFLGQAQVIPEPLRKMELLALPVLAIALLMIFWLARVLLSKRYRTAGPQNARRETPQSNVKMVNS